MKFAIKFLSLFFTILILTNSANAESPREQLKQMVEQLQKTPNDNALREKIIKLAQELKPAPVVPDEAIKYEGRAQFAFNNAESPADVIAAVKEYEKAIAIAPWVPGYYADLCTIHEKEKSYAEAKKNCEFFLASSPSTQDANDVRKRIAGMEYAIEKANSPEVQAAREAKVEQEKIAELNKSLNGVGFIRRGTFDYGTAEWEIEINSNGEITYTYNVISYNSDVWRQRLANSGYSGGKFLLGTGRVESRHIVFSDQRISRVLKIENKVSNNFAAAGEIMECEVSADGTSCECFGKLGGGTEGWTFRRR